MQAAPHTVVPSGMLVFAPSFLPCLSSCLSLPCWGPGAQGEQKGLRKGRGQRDVTAEGLQDLSLLRMLPTAQHWAPSTPQLGTLPWTIPLVVSRSSVPHPVSCWRNWSVRGKGSQGQGGHPGRRVTAMTTARYDSTAAPCLSGQHQPPSLLPPVRSLQPSLLTAAPFPPSFLSSIHPSPPSIHSSPPSSPSLPPSIPSRSSLPPIHPFLHPPPHSRCPRRGGSGDAGTGSTPWAPLGG